MIARMVVLVAALVGLAGLIWIGAGAPWPGAH